MTIEISFSEVVMEATTEDGEASIAAGVEEDGEVAAGDTLELEVEDSPVRLHHRVEPERPLASVGPEGVDPIVKL